MMRHTTFERRVSPMDNIITKASLYVMMHVPKGVRMFKQSIRAILVLATALIAQPALAERFPDVPRPIDYFVNGEEILAVNTLRDDIRAQGNFALGKALLTIGRDDLLGLNRSLSSFETGTLETPLGGEFN